MSRCMVGAQMWEILAAAGPEDMALSSFGGLCRDLDLRGSVPQGINTICQTPQDYHCVARRGGVVVRRLVA